MKGLITVGGLGTRLYPLTLGIPKSSLPIGDKAMFHYIVAEFMQAGIKEIILVYNHHQQNIFRSYLNYLRKEGEFKRVKFHFALQKELRGTLDAVYQGKRFLKKGEPLLVAYGDDLLADGKKVIQKMKEKFLSFRKPILLLEKVPMAKVSLYGVVDYQKKINGCLQIKKIVEKPKKELAPSNLTLVGRFILPYQTLIVFGKVLQKFYNRKSGEIGIDIGLNEWLKTDYALGILNPTKRFDCGSKEGFRQAQAYFSRKP